MNKGTNKRKTHAQIKTIEQRYIQEENRRTEKKPIEQRYKQEENTGTKKKQLNKDNYIYRYEFWLYLLTIFQLGLWMVETVVPEERHRSVVS